MGFNVAIGDDAGDLDAAVVRFAVEGELCRGVDLEGDVGGPVRLSRLGPAPADVAAAVGGGLDEDLEGVEGAFGFGVRAAAGLLVGGDVDGGAIVRAPGVADVAVVGVDGDLLEGRPVEGEVFAVFGGPDEWADVDAAGSGEEGEEEDREGRGSAWV